MTLSVSAPALAGKGRIALHPVVVIGGSVPESAAVSMTQAVVEELKAGGLDAIVVQDVAAPDAVSAAAPAVATDPRAPRKLAEGRKALQKLQLPKAISALEVAVAGFAGDDARTAEAALLLAEAHYRRGDEAKGRKALERVARAAPDTRLDAKKYPPVFISAFREVRSRAAKDSRPAATPAPTSDVRAGIAANACDAGMRARAVSLARAPAADVVVLLGIANGDRFFTVGGFAGDVRTGRWTTLPTLKVDAAMLSASIEGGKLARELAALTHQFAPTKLSGVAPFVDAVVAPAPVVIATPEPVAAVPDRRPLNDSTAFTTFAPPPVQTPPPVTRASAAVNLERDAALAADLAVLDSYAPAYDDTPLATSTSEVRSGGIFTKWWFWSAVAAGAALAGGTTYLLMSRDRPSDTLSVQAAW
ncbi:MAG: hypothetical protein ACAI38_07490 [Myxococcota bacterium]